VIVRRTIDLPPSQNIYFCEALPTRHHMGGPDTIGTLAVGLVVDEAVGCVLFTFSFGTSVGSLFCVVGCEGFVTRKARGGPEVVNISLEGLALAGSAAIEAVTMANKAAYSDFFISKLSLKLCSEANPLFTRLTLCDEIKMKSGYEVEAIFY
jgi:hypothetical protein